MPIMEEKRVTLRSVTYKFFTFVVGFIFISADFDAAKSTVKGSHSVCQSQECIRHANMILKNMKPEVDPCEDFYSFACGGYVAKFRENDTRSIYDDTWHNLQLQIKELLENLQPEEGSTSDKLKTVFENCMDVESSEKKSVSDALQFLSEVGIPNWPNQTKDFHFTDLSETLGKLAAYGEFAFITFKPSPYKKKDVPSDTPSPALVLPENFLLKSKITPKDVENSISRILSYFGVDKKEAEDKYEMYKKIEEIGIQLQNEDSGFFLRCKDSARNVYIEVNCSGVIHGGMKFLCQIWKSTVENGNLRKHYSSDIIHISCRWNHFYYIENIFSNLANISHRSLADYLALRFFISHLDDLNSYFRLMKKTYPRDSTSKTPGPISRWEYCVGWIVKTMNLALGYEYTQKVVTEAVQMNVMNIIRDYVEELYNDIDKLDWLNEKVKLYLQRQLQKLDIGFKATMDKYKNRTNIANYYKEFNPVRGSFLKNILEYDRTSIFKKDKVLFNSFYSSSDPYSMDFGLALLLPPTFSHGLPKIWNYATLGSVIGHELSHNFKFFFDFVHLDEETEEHLNSKMQCYVHQYSQFIIKKTGKMIISRESEEEIVADNLGWSLTEELIKVKMNDTDILYLPGLEYTPQQITYISFAQDSCAVLSKEVEAEFYATKPQNLPNLRVLGILQNSRTFSETFNCSKNAAMNPKSKCTFFN